jgi:hypothetical protein
MLAGVVWVIVFGSIAVAGVVMLISYAIWLAHKASDVMSEVTLLLDRTGQLVELLSQIRVPELPPGRDLWDGSRIVESEPAPI